MPRIKLSVNDANGVAVKNSQRLDHIVSLVGAKPLGDWRKSMDSGRGISTAYYAESFEREYEFEGDLYELKSILKGAQYTLAPPDVKIDDFNSVRVDGVNYFKLCDIDVWSPTKILFIPSWEKLRTTVVARKMKLDEEGFLRHGLARYLELMKRAPPEVEAAVRTGEEELLKIHRPAVPG